MVYGGGVSSSSVNIPFIFYTLQREGSEEVHVYEYVIIYIFFIYISSCNNMFHVCMCVCVCVCVCVCINVSVYQFLIYQHESIHLLYIHIY